MGKDRIPTYQMTAGEVWRELLPRYASTVEMRDAINDCWSANSGQLSFASASALVLATIRKEKISLKFFRTQQKRKGVKLVLPDPLAYTKERK